MTGVHPPGTPGHCTKVHCHERAVVFQGNFFFSFDSVRETSEGAILPSLEDFIVLIFRVVSKGG